jgi:hypothetical protein
MKFKHEKFDHTYGYYVQEYKDDKVPGKTLNLTKQEFTSFKEKLKDGGWNESARR